MIAGFTILLLVLLALGLPVAFALGMGGVAGMLAGVKSVDNVLADMDANWGK